MHGQPSLFDTVIRPHFERSQPEWLAEARAVGARIARERGQVTINDVREACPPPEGADPRVMGAVLRAPMFRAVGYVKSDRRDCHNRPIAIFKLNGENDEASP